MGEPRNHLSGTGRCPHCGAETDITEIVFGRHECEPWRKAAHEARQVVEQVALLEFEVGEFMRSPQGRARLAFAAWCREHGR